MPDINHSYRDIDVSEMLSAPGRTKARKTTLLIKRSIYHQRVEGLPLYASPELCHVALSPPIVAAVRLCNRFNIRALC